VAIGAHNHEIGSESASLRQKKPTHLFTAGRQASYLHVHTVTHQVARNVRARLLAVPAGRRSWSTTKTSTASALTSNGRASATARIDSRLAFHPTRMRRTCDTVLRAGNTMTGRPELRMRDSARPGGPAVCAAGSGRSSPPGPRSRHARPPRCSRRAATPLRLRPDSVTTDDVLEQGSTVPLDLLEFCSVRLAHA